MYVMFTMVVIGVNAITAMLSVILVIAITILMAKKALTTIMHDMASLSMTFAILDILVINLF